MDSEMEDVLSENGLHIQEILLAASSHDLDTLKRLIESYSFPHCNAVDVQDSETGFTPLHATIAACETEEADGQVAASAGGSEAAANGMSPQEEAVGDAKKTVHFLLENGAIWNQLDANDETPGCIALRLKLKDLYDIMVDAGVRAELLLSRLEGYKMLEDEDENEDDEEMGQNGHVEGEDDGAEPVHEDEENALNPTDRVDFSHYLSSALSLSSTKLLDDQQNGVMMAWEAGIMSKSTEAILTTPGLRVLNIGFGMGIIDTNIQSYRNKPISHHIVEAHPEVLADMKAKKWDEKPGVVIHSGRWQDILPQLVAEGEVFDAIYFDTFAESYSQFHDFFSEQVIGLLEQGGRWSFFNGMGADRQISYDVYQKVVEMDLYEAGFDVDWEEVGLPELEGEWEGVKRKYWNVEKYRLPVCRFME